MRSASRAHTTDNYLGIDISTLADCDGSAMLHLTHSESHTWTLPALHMSRTGSSCYSLRWWCKVAYTRLLQCSSLQQHFHLTRICSFLLHFGIHKGCLNSVFFLLHGQLIILASFLELIVVEGPTSICLLYALEMRFSSALSFLHNLSAVSLKTCHPTITLQT